MAGSRTGSRSSVARAITSKVPPGATRPGRAAFFAHSVRCGLGWPSSQGTTALPSRASAYSVSNQPAGSPDAAASAASCLARRRTRSSGVIAPDYVDGPAGLGPRSSSMISRHSCRHSLQSEGGGEEALAGSDNRTAWVVTRPGGLPQKLQDTCAPGNGMARNGPSRVATARPELITPPASSTHASQMYTPGPAISLRTSCCDAPQNEQYRLGLDTRPTTLGQPAPAAGCLPPL